MRLKGKVALVTGGTRGIGNALVRKLAAERAAVGFTYLKHEDLARELEESVRKNGGQVFGMKADVRIAAEVNAFVSHAVSQFGGIDLVINNAHQAYQPKFFEDATWEEFQREIDQLVKGPFNMIQAALPHLKKCRGSIINIGSTMARAPRFKHSFYVTAKRALYGLTEALALELAPRILVNAIAPGPILPPEGIARAEYDAVKKATPLGRWGGVEEIVKAVLFMIETDFVTGETIRVDGGRHLY